MTVYDVIVDPPSLDGIVKLTVARSTPPVATTDVGVSGTVLLTDDPSVILPSNEIYPVSIIIDAGDDVEPEDPPGVIGIPNCFDRARTAPRICCVRHHASRDPY